MVYRCIITLIITVNGVKYRSYLFTENFDNAEKARDYGELMVKQKLAVGYRVVFANAARADNYHWLMHEYVKFVTNEQSKMPVFTTN